jgi:hypothetical protein
MLAEEKSADAVVSDTIEILVNGLPTEVAASPDRRLSPNPATAQFMRRYRHTHSGTKITSSAMIQAAAPPSDPGTPPSSA